MYNTQALKAFLSALGWGSLVRSLRSRMLSPDLGFLLRPVTESGDHEGILASAPTVMSTYGAQRLDLGPRPMSWWGDLDSPTWSPSHQQDEG